MDDRVYTVDDCMRVLGDCVWLYCDLLVSERRKILEAQRAMLEDPLLHVGAVDICKEAYERQKQLEEDSKCVKKAYSRLQCLKWHMLMDKERCRDV